MSATVGTVGAPPPRPLPSLTLLLPELVLAHEDGGHQLPHRRLDGDVEVTRVGAGDTGRSEGMRLRTPPAPPASGRGTAGGKLRQKMAQEQGTHRAGPGTAATSLSPGACLTVPWSTPCPSQCPPSPGVHPGVPIPWRNPVLVPLSPGAPHTLSCCPLSPGAPHALCCCPLSPSAHPALPSALEDPMPYPSAPSASSCCPLSPAVPCPMEGRRCPSLGPPPSPLPPGAGHSPQLEVGRLSGVAEVDAHHHAGRVPGRQAL